MQTLAMPLNQRAHFACLMLERLGYSFCVDYGCMNAESIVEEKGFGEDLDLLCQEDRNSK